MAEFTTPIPVTLMNAVRFVFYFVPQLVADTLDNVPQFYLDIIEKKTPDNMQRLYITAKVQNGVWFLEPEEIKTQATALALQLKDYLKKHFGTGVSIVEDMPNTLDEKPLPLAEVLQYLLGRRQMINEDVVADYMTCSASFGETGNNLIRISPALLGSYIFNFWDKPQEVDSPYTVLQGKAMLFGEPMFFDLDNVSDFTIPIEAFAQFVSPRLIEETLNHSLRIIHEKGEDAKEVYIQDVEILD